MPVIYIPRVAGGTLILNVPAAGPAPTLLIIANFRSGLINPVFFRSGVVVAGGR